MMIEPNESQIAFDVFCIESVAEKLNLSGDKVFNMLRRSNILDSYISPSYDVLHTQGKDYIVNDILDCMKEQGIIQ